MMGEDLIPAFLRRAVGCGICANACIKLAAHSPSRAGPEPARPLRLWCRWKKAETANKYSHMKISNPIRVAVVEDKAAFRRGLGAIFELTPGIECVGMYATGEEALAKISKAAPEVILMDLNLPGMSGIECTRELKRMGTTAQVVMLTIEEN